MAAFEWEEAKGDWRSYDIFRHGPVTLFCRMAFFEDTVQHLQSHGYFVPQVDCRTAKTESDFYNSILFALRVLESEYKNIKPIQFWDLVTDTQFTGHKGIVLAFRHFDTIYNQFPDCAEDALEVLAQYQYRWLWSGDRYTTLVQTDDALLQLKPIRQLEANWNNQERSAEDRTAT